MGYPDMADDVRVSLAELGISTAIVLGHSMGGKVAMRLALAAPELVSRLIVADIAPVPYRPLFRAYADGMRAIDLATLKTRADADRALKVAITEPALRGFLLQSLLHTSEGLALAAQPRCHLSRNGRCLWGRRYRGPAALSRPRAVFARRAF